jgi:hypothetical protein
MGCTSPDGWFWPALQGFRTIFWVGFKLHLFTSQPRLMLSPDTIARRWPRNLEKAEKKATKKPGIAMVLLCLAIMALSPSF